MLIFIWTKSGLSEFWKTFFNFDSKIISIIYINYVGSFFIFSIFNKLLVDSSVLKYHDQFPNYVMLSFVRQKNAYEYKRGWHWKTTTCETFHDIIWYITRIQNQRSGV